MDHHSKQRLTRVAVFLGILCLTITGLALTDTSTAKTGDTDEQRLLQADEMNQPVDLPPNLNVRGLDDSFLLGRAPNVSEEAAPFCGTIISPEQQAYELSLDQRQWLGARASSLVLYRLPVSFHVVRRSDGSGGYTADRLQKSLADLNRAFEQVGMQFFRFRNGGNFVTHYLDSDSYYYNTTTLDGVRNLMQEGPIANTINIWFVPYYPGGVGVFTHNNFPQGVLLGNDAAGIYENEMIIAHEVGHYFDLYHTHRTTFGVECPDGSNCGTAGDRICDTPADPNMRGRATVCTYVGNDPTPPGCGGTYDPPVNNMMSYAPANCLSEFTPEQIDKMILTLTSIGNRLVLFQFDSTDTDGDGVADVADNCLNTPNPGQEDADGDQIGDICDGCEFDELNDIDGDGVCGDVDNCPTVSNAGQTDTDGNGIGDACVCTDGLGWISGAQMDDWYGWRVRSAGDVDGDGIDDIIVGVGVQFALAKAAVPVSIAGQALIYSGVDRSLLYTFTGESAWDQFGNSVAGVGDLDSNGHDDVLVGAWNAHFGDSASGRAYVFYTGAGPYPITVDASTAGMIFTGSIGDRLGASVDGIDDVDGDNRPDLLIGADQDKTGNSGYIQIRSGATGTLLRTIPGDVSNGSFGYSLRHAGDVNDDGNPDIIIGALNADYAKVYSAIDGSLIHPLSGVAGGFGGMVAGAGDVNDDGFDDVLVGAPWWESPLGEKQGKAYVYSGQSGAVLFEYTGDEPGDRLGWSVDGVGDLNLDGFDDFAIGVPYCVGSSTMRGRVDIHSGQDGGLIRSIDGSQDGGWFGRDICGHVDVDGDGVAELMVGAFDYTTSVPNEGRVVVFPIADIDRDNTPDACDNCMLGMTGDVNMSWALTSADIIYMVNYVFKSQAAPLPCEASGDVNCSGAVTSADIIYMVNHVFKSMDAPCDVCTLIEADTWTCP